MENSHGGFSTSLWQSNVAIGNALEMEVSIGKSPVNGPFSIAMFDSCLITGG